MEKLTFYIGVHNKNCKFQQEVIIRDVELNKGKALKLLRALKAIFNYLTTGDISDGRI